MKLDPHFPLKNNVYSAHAHNTDRSWRGQYIHMHFVGDFLSSLTGAYMNFSTNPVTTKDK